MPSQHAAASQHSPGDRASPSIHVAIVEDDPGLLDMLSRAIRAAPDMHLSGTAASLAEAMTLLEGPPADVFLVDLGLPDGSGIDVIHATTRRWVNCNIMVSTTFTDVTHVMHSIEAGATGYLLKDSSPERIVDEIRSLASGGSPISPIIARQILARLRPGGASESVSIDTPRNEVPDAGDSPLLSVREKEVLDLITKGFTTPEIANLMQLSPFTVRTFVRRIYGKLKVKSKAEAIYEARMLGLSER
ncbi:response regulator [Pandoraea sp. NPDC090278]|uniref:response regulator n=1 Tax=Pandoraea sp. NPDC090278 TaxID=3364391 RepID=UPI00383A93F7